MNFGRKMELKKMKLFKKDTFSKENIKRMLIDLFVVCLGCAIGSFATIGVLIPNGLTSGGITGIVRIVQNFLNIEFSVLYYVCAFIILIICAITMGFREARKIVLLTIIYPAFLILFEQLDFKLLEQKDIILAALYVGVISGVGCGLVFSRGYSFGGTDTIAKIIKKRLLPFVGLSQVLLAIDATIIIFSGVLFGRNIALYALVSQVIFAKTVEFVMYGFDSKFVQLEIISSKDREVAEYIMEEVGRGVTNVTIVGEYTKEEKNKLICICTPRESILIRNHISRLDKKAFVSVVLVETVWGVGEGFTDIAETK